jgi:hypothetical protein
MKQMHPSSRWVTLAPAALALLLGACGGDDSAPNNPNPNPQMDASPMPDQSAPPIDVSNPGFDAGSIMCGMNTCTGRLIGVQVGAPCCAGGAMNRCGLNFGTGCIDQTQTDGGFTPPPMDAGPIIPDNTCGNVSVTFGGMTFSLEGCCRANGQCGWYATQAPGQGCASPEQLRQIGAAVPDAPIACSGEGGTRPEAGSPDTNAPDTNAPETGSPDTTPPMDATQDSPGDVAADTANPDTGTPTDGGAGDTGPTTDGGSTDGTSADAGTD